MNWRGLGKKRSRFGEYIDEKEISQWDMSVKSHVNRDTISKLANDDDAKPSWKVRGRIVDALREDDEDVSGDDFWDD